MIPVIYWLLLPAALLALWSEFDIAWPFWIWLAFSAFVLIDVLVTSWRFHRRTGV